MSTETKIKNFTTTLPVQILKELDSASKDLGAPKNEILADAFLEWNKERKQALVANSYRESAKDTEWCRLTEEGLDDWNKEILKWEK